jgi:hypothetical protein
MELDHGQSVPWPHGVNPVGRHQMCPSGHVYNDYPGIPWNVVPDMAGQESSKGIHSSPWTGGDHHPDHLALVKWGSGGRRLLCSGKPHGHPEHQKASNQHFSTNDHKTLLFYLAHDGCRKEVLNTPGLSSLPGNNRRNSIFGRSRGKFTIFPKSMLW